MLTKFKVENFKNFKNQFVFNFTQSNYEFSSEAVKDGVVNKGIVFGHNGCGKSNLGLALFDIVLHLTDKEKMIGRYPVYLNLNSNKKYASFEYDFLFEGQEVVYQYTKFDFQVLRTEKLIINGETVVEYDYTTEKGFSNLDGTQTLRINSPDSKLSKLKFIRNNAILADNQTNHLFELLMDYVDRMLLFYSLGDNGYQGFELGGESLDDVIVRSGKLKQFERFLHKAEIQEHLESQEINGKYIILFKYKNGSIPFAQAASRGTHSLELFYFWYLRLTKASFVFIDEYDAFYHFELSEMIVKELLKLHDQQIVLTTHNTDLLSNDLLRPDCYFVMTAESISSLDEKTSKELRKAHNLQKMYKAGAFDE